MDTRQAYEYLLQHYPKSFNRENPVPLKIGIHLDIFKAIELNGLTECRKAFRRALSYHIKRKRYLQALARPGVKRVSLMGSACGYVSREHRLRAIEQLTAINQQKPVATQGAVQEASSERRSGVLPQASAKQPEPVKAPETPRKRPVLTLKSKVA